MNTRWVASQCLYAVIINGASLSDVLQTINSKDPREIALIKDICFGSLRWHHKISAILKQLINKSLKKRDKDVECLLRVGLYQLAYQHTPSHAAVNETVSASRYLKKKWSRGFINGTLRTYLRQQASIEKQLNKVNPLHHYSHPEWLIKKLQQDWPSQWKMLLQANNQRAPMTIRVNSEHYSRKAYQALLTDNGIETIQHPHVASALILKDPCSIDGLPHFHQGASSIQDASAQLAALLLDCKPRMNVLDACAAPGGKTGHLLETYPEINLTAIDNSAVRLARVTQNLQRLKKHATLIEADAGNIDAWHQGKRFDRILLDAPCSATGVIRRHPDIKILRQPSDIKKITVIQRNLLEQLWSLLQPNGRLLYVTCSLLKEENDQQIKQFLQQVNDANCITIEGKWGIQQRYGRQILTQNDMDGFYFALLEKII